jgi:hypothetical protein
MAMSMNLQKMTENSMKDNLGLLCVEGADAAQFLQGQLTCDVNKVTSTQTSLAAHCNPQGRIISLSRLFLHEGSYYLQMPTSMIPIALAALKKYAIFYKVLLKDATELLSSIPCCVVNESQRDIDFKRGIPAIYPETSEKFLPHEINLPALNAVSFDKGCYVGQEIIARLHYRGQLKTQFYFATVKTEADLQRGADLYNKEKKKIGTLVNYDKINDALYALQIISAEPDGLFLDENALIPLQRGHFCV